MQARLEELPGALDESWHNHPPKTWRSRWNALAIRRNISSCAATTITPARASQSFQALPSYRSSTVCRPAGIGTPMKPGDNMEIGAGRPFTLARQLGCQVILKSTY